MKRFYTDANGAGLCCFEFHKRSVPASNIVSYEETRSECTLPGVMYVFNPTPFVLLNSLEGFEYLISDYHGSNLTQIFIHSQFYDKKGVSPVC